MFIEKCCYYYFYEKVLYIIHTRISWLVCNKDSMFMKYKLIIFIFGFFFLQNLGQLNLKCNVEQVTGDKLIETSFLFMQQA